jgi:hypothetical protein
VPVAERTRTYVATIASSPQATVTLSGGTFWHHATEGLRNTFLAFVQGDTVSLSIPAPYGVIEQINPDTYFYFRGTGAGAVTRDPIQQLPSEISVTLTASAGFGEDLLDPARHHDCAAAGGLVTLKFTPRAGPAPPPLVAHSITRIDLAAPESVPPGPSAQLSVTGVLTDGSTRDVTNQSIWRTSATGTLNVSPAGLASGLKPGEGIVSVSVPRPNLNALTRTRELLVLPAGTFRLTGTVSDSFGLMAEVTVAVTGGPAAGQSSVTGATGEYRLYGVSGETPLRISRGGYQTLEPSVHVSGHQKQDFDLRPAGSRRDVSGTYTLTITAAGHCRTWPEPFRTRRYTATVDQDGNAVEVTLGGARFLLGPGRRGNRFRGRLLDDEVEFFISYYPQSFYGTYFPMPDHPEVVEELSSGYLLLSGPLPTTLDAAGLATGDLFGVMMIVSDLNRITNTDITCASPYGPGHRFVFSR